MKKKLTSILVWLTTAALALSLCTTALAAPAQKSGKEPSEYEPVVEVVTPGQEKVTYVKMTAEKALRVVNDHLVNGNVVSEYTIGANAIGAK